MADLGQNTDASQGMERVQRAQAGLPWAMATPPGHVASPPRGGGGQKIPLGSAGCIWRKASPSP